MNQFFTQTISSVFFKSKFIRTFFLSGMFLLIYSGSFATHFSYDFNTAMTVSPPVAICKNITIQLDSAGSVTITANDVDDGSYSSAGIASMTISQYIFDCSNVGTNLVDLIVLDSIGNSDTCQAIVTVQDTIAPVISCPSALTVGNDPGECGAIVNYDVPKAIDNCSPISLQIALFPYAGTTIQQWTVPEGITSIRIKAAGGRGGSNIGGFGGGGVGGFGASVEGDFTVTPGDTLNILAAGHGIDSFNTVLTINTGGGGGSFVWKNIGDTLLIAAGGGSGLGSCAHQSGTSGLSTLGGSGNGGLAGSTDCGSEQGGGGGAGWLSNGGDTPANSNIGGHSPLNGGIGGLAGATVNYFTNTGGGFGGGGGGGGNCGGPGGGGGYTGGDGGDNILCAYQYASGGTSYNIGTNQSGATGVNNNHGFVEISWLGTGPFAGTLIDGLPSGSYFPFGTTTQTYVAADAAGNTDTCSFTVTVQDTEVPVAICQDITIGLNALGNVSIVAADVDGGSTDNCGIASLTLDNSFFTCENLGTNEVVLTVMDINGNSSTCTAIVAVEDYQIPIFTNCPGDVTLNALTNNCFQNYGWPKPVYFDNCSNAIISISTSDSTVSVFDFGAMHFASFPVGTTMVMYEVTDGSGNMDFCSFNVTVNDNQNPKITGCPADIIVAGICNSIVNWNPPTASDNCSGVSLTTTHASGSIFPIGTTTVTYTATDASGNTAACSFNVTIIAPPLSATIATTHLSCHGGENGTATVTVTSGCFPYTYSWSTLPVQTQATATGLSAGSYTVVVTDVNGTTTELTVTLTEPPLLVASAGPNKMVYYGYSQYACTTLTSTVSGGVTPYKYLWSTGNTTSSVSVCPASGQHYTLTVTDANGCTSTDVVKVCVVDVRCQGNRVEVCYTFPDGTITTLCVPSFVVPLFLALGATLGECGSITSCPDDGGIKEIDAKSELRMDALSLMCYPNPFNLQATVRFSSTEAGNVEVVVYNMMGIKVATLFNGTVNAMEMHETNFNAEKLSDGIYFVKLITQQGEMKVERVILSR